MSGNVLYGPFLYLSIKEAKSNTVNRRESIWDHSVKSTALPLSVGHVFLTSLGLLAAIMFQVIKAFPILTVGLYGFLRVSLSVTSSHRSFLNYSANPFFSFLYLWNLRVLIHYDGLCMNTKLWWVYGSGEGSIQILYSSTSNNTKLKESPTERKDTLQYVWKIKSSETLCECLPAVLHLMHASFQEGHIY